MTNSLSLPRLLDGHLRAVLEPPRDGRVRARHDLVAGLDAVLDLDVRRVGDAGVDRLLVHRVAVLDEDHALQLLAQLALLLLLLHLVGDVGLVVAAVARGLLRAGLLALLGREIAAADARGHALDRHDHGVLHRRRLHVRGRAHARAEAQGTVGDADLHLEIRDLFLAAGVPRRGRAGDLAHDAADDAVGIGVDADARRLADVDVRYVVLVDVDDRFHVVEVCDAHHLGAGELARADDALADAAGERADRTVGRRVDDGLRQRVADLPQRPLGALDLEQRRLQRRPGHVVLRPRRIAVRLRQQLGVVEALGALVVLLRLRQLGAVAHARRACAAQGRLLRLHLRLVRVGLDADEELPAVDEVPLLHRDLDDLTRDLGRDLHLDFRLDLAGRGGELGD